MSVADKNIPLASVNYTFRKLSGDPELQYSTVHFIAPEEVASSMFNVQHV